jgi:ribonuclease Z
MGDARKGIKLTYCTDTRPTQSIIDHSQDADLFICEGMYGEPGKESKALEYKHMTFQEAATLANKANVKELWLTHFSPSLVRPEEFMHDVRKVFPNAYAGKDGKTVELLFEEE